ncbi:hypothetical protein RUM44_013570 [Polyplax serrata]|uniref:UDENN FNIP1/2-type domain-containing protein n=1 Tax=Polyplax serrata TaxID=468196 RepID=A0ABR1BI81_POLSC
MSFFDKFFSHKNSNKTENELKGVGEPLSLKSSDLHISKEQIRFLLFRECDRRGRKLLFDSNAVEKIPLPNNRIIKCTRKIQQQGSKKNSDFIETTLTHGYKYKKLPNDVACLGEMIFGSVAMTYKGENSCKIHKIPSPKQLMFTTIIHAPIRCHQGAINECSLENSMSSIDESASQKETSSDSKLYRPAAEAVHKCPSTYPCIKNNPALNKLTQCCDSSDDNDNVTKALFSQCENRLQCFESTFSNNQEQCGTNKCPSVKKLSADTVDLYRDILILNLSQKNSGCDKASSSNLDSTSSIVSSESENVSSVSGSLSSLRRRWAQSCSTSLDIKASEDVNNTPCKKRAKLGMAIVLELSDSDDDKMENFLFNHTILIDSMMSKLQSSVELAYIKTQNFVDLIYTAFLDTQQSIHDFITGGKYMVPLWIALIGDTSDIDDVDNISNKEVNLVGRNSKTNTKQDSVNSAKINFLNNFHDILVKFDTKDTNFFISTLLTAVLTHHLSWVTGIAETDLPNRHEKIQSIKNYNPIWAQLNDLYGLLGSPLKCAKTIVKGSESKKSHITSILQVLTYFIRCFNVIENVYDVEMQNIVGEVENSAEVKNFNSAFESLQKRTLCERGQMLKKVPVSDERLLDPSVGNSKVHVDVNKFSLNEGNGLTKAANIGKCLPTSCGLKRNKACLSQLTLDNSNSVEIYPDVRDIHRFENIHEEDLEGQIFPNDTTMGNGIKNSSSKSDNEGYLSPDEGYDTIDSTKTEVLHPRKIDMERQMSSAEKPSGSEIVFILGENEKLVNLKKKVVLTKSDVIELESEDFKCETLKKSTESVSDVNCQMCECRTLSKECMDKGKPPWTESCCCNGDTKMGSLGGPNACDVPMMFLELSMPSETKPCRRKHLGVSPVFGGVNQKYNSEQIVQGLIDPENNWEQALHKDLFLWAYNSTVEKDVNEALCIVGDVESWEVSVRSSNTCSLDRNKHSGVRVGMSQLVADMLESFLHLHKINLPPNFCLLHIEKKLRGIYLKSKTVAELLNSTDLCTIDYLTSRLDVGINDIPLLLSVATTHCPQLSERNGLTFT